MSVANGYGTENEMREGWKNEIIASFTDIYQFNDEESADAYVLVGTCRIYLHQMVLKLNSSVLQSSGILNKSCGKLEIDILPEFSDEVELVTNILQSLYTGTIVINQQNMKMIYKFCKCYSVQWLLDYTLPIILDTLSTRECESFIDVFKFAHSVWCKNLMDACIERLNSDLADRLIRSKIFFQFDFYCVKTIVSSESVYLPELQIFELVYKWCEGDLEQRSCHIAELLSHIQYHLIDKDNLTGQIFEWILSVSGVEEQARIRVLVKVKEGMRNTIDMNKARNLPPQVAGEEGNHGTLTRENDALLNKMMIKLEDDKAAEITPEELNSLIKEKFKQTDYSTQHCILDYVTKYKKLTESNITSCLKLYEISRLGRVIWCCLQYVLNPKANYNIDHIDWKQIPYSTITAIIQNESVKAQFREYDYNKKGYFNYLDGDKYRASFSHGQRFYGATNTELIMLWAQAHSKEKANIAELLGTLCYTSIPLMYKQSILLPHIQMLLPDVTQLECVDHETHTKAWTVPEPLTLEVPSEVYLIQTFATNVVMKSGSNIELSFNKTNSSKLELSHNFNDYNYYSGSKSCLTKHILFDTTMCITQYPLFRTSDDIKHLRRVTDKSSYLHVMFIPPDESTDWELIKRAN